MRREVSIFVDGETIAECERVRIEGREEIVLVVLCIFPVRHCSGQIGVQGIDECLEEGSGSV